MMPQDTVSTAHLCKVARQNDRRGTLGMRPACALQKEGPRSLRPGRRPGSRDGSRTTTHSHESLIEAWLQEAHARRERGREDEGWRGNEKE